MVSYYKGLKIVLALHLLIKYKSLHYANQILNYSHIQNYFTQEYLSNIYIITNYYLNYVSICNIHYKFNELTSKVLSVKQYNFILFSTKYDKYMINMTKHELPEQGNQNTN